MNKERLSRSALRRWAKLLIPFREMEGWSYCYIFLSQCPHTMNSLLPYMTSCWAMSLGSLPWPGPSLVCLKVECLGPLSFCLPFSGLKVPRLLNLGLSSSAPSGSTVKLSSRLSHRRGWGGTSALVGLDSMEGDFEWKRKRRAVAEEDG